MSAAEKNAMRRRLGAALRSMTPEERAAGAGAIGATLERLLALPGNLAGNLAGELLGESRASPRGPSDRRSLIMGYLALPREVDLVASMRRWIAAGHGIVVPRVDVLPRDPRGPGARSADSAADDSASDGHQDRGRIVPVQIESLEPTQFAIDRFGVRSPLGGEVVDAASINVVLVPGLGFDRSGRRLGRGGGHYDRFLAEVPASIPRIGVCFARQMVDSIPDEPHDVRVDVVVSDAGVSYTPRIPQALRSFGQGLVDDAASGR